MREIIDAVFDNGNFRPVGDQEIALSQGQRVKLIVETFPEPQDDMAELAAKVYEGLTDKEIEEIENITLTRNEFFTPGTVR